MKLPHETALLPRKRGSPLLNSFLIALNAVLPLMLYLALGFFLVRMHIVQEDFMQALNRFTFRVLFPFMMFNNVYAASPEDLPSTKSIAFSVVSLLAQAGSVSIANRT